MSSTPPLGFVVLVPLKPTSRAKSRLSALGDEPRRDLVRAFARDTLTAAKDAPGVVGVMVVTDDHRFAAELRSLDVMVLPDGVTDDLNASLAQAAAEVDRRTPEAGVAALCADLPALDPADLGVALAQGRRHRSWFVADADGQGTTLYAASSAKDFAPCFGTGSREEHLASGAHEVVEVGVPTLRRDVDTPADLRSALHLGVGTRTAEAVSRHRL